MEFYETPYVFVGNKVTSSEDKNFISTQLDKDPATFLMESTSLKRSPSLCVSEWGDKLQTIFAKAKKANGDNRLERTVQKFKRNHEFANG